MMVSQCILVQVDTHWTELFLFRSLVLCGSRCTISEVSCVSSESQVSFLNLCRSKRAFISHGLVYKRPVPFSGIPYTFKCSYLLIYHFYLFKNHFFVYELRNQIFPLSLEIQMYGMC